MSDTARKMRSCTALGVLVLVHEHLPELPGELLCQTGGMLLPLRAAFDEQPDRQMLQVREVQGILGPLALGIPAVQFRRHGKELFHHGQQCPAVGLELFLGAEVAT